LVGEKIEVKRSKGYIGNLLDFRMVRAADFTLLSFSSNGALPFVLLLMKRCFEFDALY
jgi:hypothetical protein